MNNKITLAAVGDIFLGRGVEKTIDQHGPRYIFERVAPCLLAHDVVVGNLESPIADVPDPSAGRLFARPASLAGLQHAGFNALALANNHIMDYGLPALRDTLASLKQAGIGAAGAGLNEAEARRPLTGVAGKNVTLLSYYGMGKGGNRGQPADGRLGSGASGDSGGHNSGEAAKVFADIAEARQRGDVVLVAVHWGLADKLLPLKYQVEFARQLIDRGARVVLGSGPHVLQPVERYNGGVIAYSLGNFVFDHDVIPEHRQSMILSLSIVDGQVEQVDVTPVSIGADNSPAPIDPPAAPELHHKIRSLLVERLDKFESDAAVISHIRLKSLTPRNIARKIIRRRHGVYPLSFYLRALVSLARERWLARGN